MGALQSLELSPFSSHPVLNPVGGGEDCQPIGKMRELRHSDLGLGNVLYHGSPSLPTVSLRFQRLGEPQ